MRAPSPLYSTTVRDAADSILSAVSRITKGNTASVVSDLSIYCAALANQCGIRTPRTVRPVSFPSLFDARLAIIGAASRFAASPSCATYAAACSAFTGYLRARTALIDSATPTRLLSSTVPGFDTTRAPRPRPAAGSLAWSQQPMIGVDPARAYAALQGAYQRRAQAAVARTVAARKHAASKVQQ